MKRMIAVAVLAGLMLGGAMETEAMSGEKAAKGKQARVLRHVVLFQIKEGTSPEKIKEVEDAFRALPKKIDAIIDFEWGTDVSVESKSQGFTHCFFVTFPSEKARDEYLPHPDHKAFGKIVRSTLEKVLVVDYWVKK